MLFARVYSADYSGAGENHHPSAAIRLCRARPSRGAAVREILPSSKASPQKRWSRDDLTLFIRRSCADHDPSKQRCLFTLDAQFSWPKMLWQRADLSLDTPWRQAVTTLARGRRPHPPPLDIPRRYCRAFNRSAGREIFWSPLKRRARQYRLPDHCPHEEGNKDRWRLCESSRPRADLGWPGASRRRPMPADAVGGQGIGSVGGQTLCALRQFAALIAACPNLAFWPMDGLNIDDPAYRNRHVMAEMYCALTLPKERRKSDWNDAFYSCRTFAEEIVRGRMPSLMSLRHRLPPPDHTRVRREGWILGMAPHPACRA